MRREMRRWTSERTQRRIKMQEDLEESGKLHKSSSKKRCLIIRRI